jgi:hypothetical protein
MTTENESRSITTTIPSKATDTKADRTHQLDKYHQYRYTNENY